VFSLNVPVPGAVAQLAADLHPRLVDFDQIRDHRTLVAKRFDESTLPASQPELQLARLQQRVPQVLTGTPAFEAETRAIDFFAEPVRGAGPVVYLTVDSPGLRGLHDRFTDEFGTIPELEGDDYTPHITLARGGSVADAERLAGEIDPISWTVSQLQIWDSRYREAVSRYSLPA
jgi:2'-5' RNA ligase